MWFAPGLAAFLVLTADIGTKFWAHGHLPHFSPFLQYPYGGVGIFQDFLGLQFSLNYVVNKGAAWGLFSEYSQMLLVFRLGLILWLVLYFLKLPLNSRLRLPLTLIISGAVGNIIDIFIYGHVIDMFHWNLWGYDYPIFNVADSAICIGVGLFLIRSFTSSHASARQS